MKNKKITDLIKYYKDKIDLNIDNSLNNQLKSEHNYEKDIWKPNE